MSYVFGTDVIDTFLARHNLSLIVRAHQVVEDGYEFFHHRKLVTLFSAPNYCSQFDNAGAVMIVKEDLTCSFSILPVRPINLTRRLIVTKREEGLGVPGKRGSAEKSFKLLCVQSTHKLFFSPRCMPEQRPDAKQTAGPLA